MKIKKLGHCCLVIHAKGQIIMTDPGFYSLEQHVRIPHVDIVLITHEHQDHFHIESLKELVKRMPNIEVVVNDSVSEILEKEGIKHRMMKDGDSIEVKGVKIEAHGKLHASLHSSIPQSNNTGYFIDETFFLPGDAFPKLKKPVDVLALPLTGPWMKVAEALDYAISVKPRMTFPIHDAVRSGFEYVLAERVLPKFGIDFLKLEEGGEFEVK